MRLLPGRCFVTEESIDPELFVMDVLDAVVERAGVEREMVGNAPHGWYDCCSRLVRNDRP